MARQILLRNNFFDGQRVSEEDLDTEQTAWHDSLANNTDLLAGSGVELEFPVQRTLFDSNNIPATTQSLIDTNNFDGEPIFPEDSFGNTVFIQPSDSVQGVQLDVQISGSSLDGTPTLKVYLFGTIFGGDFVQEVFVFDENGSQITRNYYTTLVAFMTQDFKGNQNTIVDGVASRNNGGRLKILEALPMRVARDSIMAEQAEEPNVNYVNFKPATLFKTLDDVLSDIANSANLNEDDLNIKTTATTTRTLPPNQTGLIIGEKFLATTDNIQNITILLSIEKRTLVPAGQEFDWSGDIVVGIRKLQTITTCPTDIVPNTAIEFDPEPAPIAEVSFDKLDLEALGIVLDDTSTEVDFIFTQSTLANPAVDPDIEVGAHYVVTIRRTGNISVGTVILQEAANTDAGVDDVDEKRMTVFTNNVWTDVPESDLWFRIHTDAIRIVDGTAFDNGVQITSPKVKENVITSVEEPFIEGFHSLIDTSQTGENFVIVQRSNRFSQAEPHPTTGNLVFTRLEDAPDVSVVSSSTLQTLLDADNKTIILGLVIDTNPVNNPIITGTTSFPGLAGTNTFTIIEPASDILTNNLNGSILIPNTLDPNTKYRIIKKEVFTDLFGDVNNDGLIDIEDVTRAQELGNVVSGDGYAKNLEDGLVPSSVQKAALDAGLITIEEIIRADVNDTGRVSVADVTLIQQNIALGTAFPAGSSFTRVVLTVESLTDPLTTTPDILGSDSSFNAVPFTAIEFRIDFVPLWTADNISITDLRRFIPKTFTEVESSDITGTTKNGGTNTAFVPDDLLLGGSLLNVNGTDYSIDLEVNNVIVELPEGSTQGEIDVFNSFIRGQMKFFDNTLVGSGALTSNQVKVTTSIQSFVKDLSPDGVPIEDGYDFQSIDGYAAIDETIAVLYTQSTGILRIRAANIRNLATRPELRTKIVLAVFLKKAGFINTERTVDADEVNDLLLFYQCE